MRWITFFILLYLVAVLQGAAFLGWPHGNGSWPRIEYLALLAIFYALFAAEPAAPICGLLCGVVYDIGNGQLFGLHAVPLAIMALLVVRVRLSIFREHVGSQVLVTLLAVLVFAVFDVVMQVIVGAPLDGGSVWTLFGELAANAVYTAAAAPVVFWIFFRFGPLLGFSSHGPRTRLHDGRR